MKIFTLRQIFFATACLVLAGCGESDTMRRLGNADAVIESDSYAAMDTLELVKGADLRSDEERAFYALLFTQAQIKNWIVVDSDSLIGRAYDYYRDRREGDRTIRAYFYKAKVSYKAKNFQGAVRDALVAYEMAKADRVPYWIARSAELLCDIFFDVYNFPLAEEYSRETVLNYGLAGRESSQRYAIADLGALLYNQSKFTEAENLLDSLKEECLKSVPVDSAVYKYMGPTYDALKINLGKFEDLINGEFYNPSSAPHISGQIDVMINQSDTRLHEGKEEESKNILKDALVLAATESDSAVVLYAKYLNAKKTGHFAEAVTLTDTLIRLQSNIAQKLLYQHVNQEKSNFYHNLSETSKIRSEKLYLSWILTFSVGLSIIIILSIIYYFRRKEYKAKIEATIEALIQANETNLLKDYQNQSLQERLIAENKKISELKSSLNEQLVKQSNSAEIIQELFRTKWQTLNLLCKEYYDNEDTRDIIFNNIRKELKKLTSKKHILAIEEEVNKYMNDIVKLLRAECKFLREVDVNFISLIFAGFDAKTVCIFMGIKHKYFYLKRERLKARIESSDAEHKQLFLDNII